MAMTKACLVLSFLSVMSINVFGLDVDGWVSDKMGLRTIKQVRIEGAFTDYIRNEDTSDYRVTALFSNQQYPFRYYSASEASDQSNTDSRIELFGQSFVVGSNRIAGVDYGGVSPDIVVSQSKVFGFSSGNRDFVYIVSPVGGSAYYNMVNLFDVTDPKAIRYFYFQTWFESSKLLVASDESQSIDIVIIDQNDSGDADWRATIYTLANGSLERKMKDDQELLILFNWSKWKSDTIQLVRSSF